MQLYKHIITYYAMILVYIIMDLNSHEDLIQKRVLAQKQILNLKKKNIDFENQKVDRDFYNAELFKPIIDTNEKMIDKMEEKNDKINEIISNTLPYYEDQDQDQMQEQLSLPLLNEDEKIIYNFSKPLEPIQRDFLDELTENNQVFLYKKKNGDDVYSNVKIIGVDNLKKASDDELKSELKSKNLKKLSNRLIAFYRFNKDNKVPLLYRGAIGKYQKLIKDILSSRNYVEKKENNEDNDNIEDITIEEIEGDGIKKKNVMDMKL